MKPDVSRELSEPLTLHAYEDAATEAVGAFLQRRNVPEPVRGIAWGAVGAAYEVYAAEIERLRTELAQSAAALQAGREKGCRGLKIWRLKNELAVARNEQERERALRLKAESRLAGQDGAA